MNRRWLALALAGVLALVSCGGGDASVVLEGENVTLNMFDNRFEFTEIRIPVGGSVDYHGAGRNPHNAVASDGSWTTEDVFGSLEQYEGDSAVITYHEAGTWTFFCTFHGNAAGAGMAATLIVGEPEA
ncbi:MAG: plastocyanin/azurin family copper-binding protein [Acidimicrobiia bacterium]